MHMHSVHERAAPLFEAAPHREEMTMAQHTRVGLATIVLLVLAWSGVSAVVGAQSAQPVNYVLHGTGQFGKSSASAIVTDLSGNHYRLSLTAKNLPPPATGSGKYARRAYVAWLVNGELMHGPLRIAAVGLAADRVAGSYTGQGTVTMDGVTSVIITAEPTAQARMPIMRVTSVLASDPGVAELAHRPTASRFAPISERIPA